MTTVKIKKNIQKLACTCSDKKNILKRLAKYKLRYNFLKNPSKVKKIQRTFRKKNTRRISNTW